MLDLKVYRCIDVQDLQVLFIASYDDVPLEGLVKYQGQVVRFVMEPETLQEKACIYRIEQLSAAELAYELKEKADFENAVGAHWSFDDVTGEPLPRVFADEKCSEAYYNKKSLEKEMQKMNTFPPPVILGWSTAVR